MLCEALKLSWTSLHTTIPYPYPLPYSPTQESPIPYPYPLPYSPFLGGKGRIIFHCQFPVCNRLVLCSTPEYDFDAWVFAWLAQRSC